MPRTNNGNNAVKVVEWVSLNSSGRRLWPPTGGWPEPNPVWTALLRVRISTQWRKEDQQDEKRDQPTNDRTDGCCSHSFTMQAQPFGHCR